MTWISEGQRLLFEALLKMERSEAAKRCGVDASTISRWLSGMRTPQDFRLRVRIELVLKIPVASWDPTPAAA
jgi:transcriptional regulator with XRE-family HTH domain